MKPKHKFEETNHGLVILYTGEGKGKTTAALGLALRAAGYKRKVLIIQFGKIWFTGELEGVKKLTPYVKLIQSGKWEVVIADELVGSVHAKMITQKQVLDLIKARPKLLDFVLTGHHAKPALIKASDLATEMMPIKHPFEKGFLAKPGIDY